MGLAVVWFVLVALLWTGFFVLEGFDFGVGMLHTFVGRTDEERQLALDSIGPLWDGNEVWLIVAAAAMFAAFPGWYATMFSGFYLPLVLLLVALIVRGVSFEYRDKRESHRWRGTWSLLTTLGSLVAPLADRCRPRRPRCTACRSTRSRTSPAACSTSSALTACSSGSPWSRCA